MAGAKKGRIPKVSLRYLRSTPGDPIFKNDDGIEVDMMAGPEIGSGRPAGKLPDGTAIEGSTDEQKMAIYISTLSTTSGGDGSNPFEAPTTATTTNGTTLTSPLEVSADTTGTMIMDTSGKVEPNGTECDMQPPKFGFK